MLYCKNGSILSIMEIVFHNSLPKPRNNNTNDTTLIIYFTFTQRTDTLHIFYCSRIL